MVPTRQQKQTTETGIQEITPDQAGLQRLCKAWTNVVELAVRRYLDDIEHAHERGLVGFFSSSDSTGGSVDDVDEDGPWDETDPMFYEMHDDAMDF